MKNDLLDDLESEIEVHLALLDEIVQHEGALYKVASNMQEILEAMYEYLKVVRRQS